MYTHEKQEVERLEQEKKSWLSRGVSAEFEKKEKVEHYIGKCYCYVLTGCIANYMYKVSVFLSCLSLCLICFNSSNLVLLILKCFISKRLVDQCQRHSTHNSSND